MLFSIGLAKKVLIADNFAPLVKYCFETSPSLTFLEVCFGSVAYTLQLYFDFSAYSDMAVGAALLFNIRLPWNFDSPYKALDIQDFWRRLHITLSRWLRDYLYISLGGNRKGKGRTLGNLFMTFLLGTARPGPSSSGAGCTALRWLSTASGGVRGCACQGFWAGSSPLFS